MDISEFVTVSEASKMAMTSRQRIRHLAVSGRLGSSQKVGKAWLISKGALAKYVESKNRKPEVYT